MKLKVKNLERTTSRFPSQWEGKTIDDEFIYIRYRSGWLEVSVASTRDESYNYEYNVFIMNDGTKNGEMETDEMLKITGIELVEHKKDKNIIKVGDVVELLKCSEKRYDEKGRIVWNLPYIITGKVLLLTDEVITLDCSKQYNSSIVQINRSQILYGKTIMA